MHHTAQAFRLGKFGRRFRLVFYLCMKYAEGLGTPHIRSFTTILVLRPPTALTHHANQVAPMVMGVGEHDNESPLELPKELSWAESNNTIKRAICFLAAEAELMASDFIPPAVRTSMESWVLTWNGGKAPAASREGWLRRTVR